MNTSAVENWYILGETHGLAAVCHEDLGGSGHDQTPPGSRDAIYASISRPCAQCVAAAQKPDESHLSAKGALHNQCISISRASARLACRFTICCRVFTRIESADDVGLFVGIDFEVLEFIYPAELAGPDVCVPGGPAT